MPFPPLPGYSDAQLVALGYRVRRVSVFDRWLSEAEAAACETMSFGIARRADALAQYVEGERRFLDFYHGMALTGVADCHGALSPVAAERIIRESLREAALMDIRFPELSIRAVGGWNRTDLLLLEPGADADALDARVRRHGLHILP